MLHGRDASLDYSRQHRLRECRQEGGLVKIEQDGFAARLLNRKPQLLLHQFGEPERQPAQGRGRGRLLLT